MLIAEEFLLLCYDDQTEGDWAAATAKQAIDEVAAATVVVAMGAAGTAGS